MYGPSSSTLPERAADAHDGTDDRFVPLTREQAAALRAANPPLSPWRVVAVQAAVGLVVAVLGAAIAASAAIGWSALYGAAVVVVPGALMAWGLTRRSAGTSPGAGVAGFMLWEMVKIAVAVLMLALAPWVVPALSWLALLAGMVVCLKVYWVALLWRGRGGHGKN
jgi:ATP synthase protein I